MLAFYIATLFISVAFLYLSSGFLLLLFRQARSPLRHLPGPRPRSFFMGNLVEMHEQENTNLIPRWEALYGSSFVYRGFVGGCRLLTTDPVAIAHILGNAYDYPKPDFVRDSLATMAVGHQGLLTVEGEDHRRQRKIINSAFSATHISSLAPIFWEKAYEMKDIWLSEHATSSQLPSTPVRIDVLSWLGRATLDAIGQAGFGYSFHSLTDSQNELALAFATIFNTARKFRVMTILQAWFPFLRKFRRNSTVQKQAIATMRRIGSGLVADRIREAQSSGGEKVALPGRDLLSVLVRANVAAYPSHRLSDEETLSQIATFIAAGQETTASALTWMLYALAKHPSAQRKLREELVRHSSSPSPSMDDTEDAIEKGRSLGSLVYLDAVVREGLRLHAPVTSTMRVCMRERDVVPVGMAFKDAKGRIRTNIELKKWDIISLPLQAVNRSVELWGDDALEFRPERWLSAKNETEKANVVPGLWANTLTFLNGNPMNGNRACIGYKFALLEIKIFLAVLIRDIEFGIDPNLVVEKKVNVVTRPYLPSEPDRGNQLPLLIRPATKPLG